MKKVFSVVVLSLLITSICYSQEVSDTTAVKALSLEEVVVTGSRVALTRDVMPVPISIVNRNAIQQKGETSLLPVLS